MIKLPAWFVLNLYPLNASQLPSLLFVYGSSLDKKLSVKSVKELIIEWERATDLRRVVQAEVAETHI